MGWGSLCRAAKAPSGPSMAPPDIRQSRAETPKGALCLFRLRHTPSGPGVQPLGPGSWHKEAGAQSDHPPGRPQHLATFIMDKSEAIVSVDDAIRKLVQLSAKEKIWTQEMLLQVNDQSIRLLDVESQVRPRGAVRASTCPWGQAEA